MKFINILLLQIIISFTAQSKEGVCKLVSVGGTQTVTYIDGLTRKPIPGREIETIKLDEKGPYTYCSASLVNDNHILTAAHCFQGSIDQNIEVYTIPIRVKVKRRINGEIKLIIPPYCNDPYWKEKRACIARYERAVVRMNLGTVSAHCYDKNGKFQKSAVEVKNGWPHPMYARANTKDRFDAAVLKVKTSFKNIKPFKTQLDPKKMIRILDYNGKNCKAYGFGKNPDGSSGILRTLNIFIDDYSDVKIGSNRIFDSIAPGDSGGPLICPDLNQNEVHIGIVSHDILRQGAFLAPDIHQDVFTSLAYNQEWIKKVLKLPKVKKRTEEDFHKVAAEYEVNYYKNEIKNGYDCLKRNKHKFNKPTAPFTAKQFKSAVKEIEKEYKKIMKDYGKEEFLFTRGRLKGKIYKKTLDLRYNCFIIDL